MLPELGVQTTATFVSQLSEAVTTKSTLRPARGTQPRSIVGGSESVGGVVSVATLTLNEQLFSLLRVSRAVQVTVVWPGGKTLADGGMHTTVIPPPHVFVA